MTYSYELHRSIDDVDGDTWRDLFRNSTSLLLDPRFLKVLELSFAHETALWYVIFRDQTDRAVAATCFCRFRADVLLLAPPLIHTCCGYVRRIWPGFLKYNVLVCGLPYTTGESHFAIAANVDTDSLLTALDEAAYQIAATARCWMILLQELPSCFTVETDVLKRFGYLRTKSVCSYRFAGEFESFAAYLASLKHHRRNDIKRSQRRFEDAGLTCELLRGSDGADRLFTPDVYRLYLTVFERAKLKLEQMPLQFFQEFARRLPEESRFAILRRGEQIVAFGCGLAGQHDFVLMKVGYDSLINHEVDLYFNLIYRMLEQAFAPGIRVIHFGATADQFKQRLGCQGRWLSIYFKSSNSLRHRYLLKPVFNMLFKQPA